MSGPDASRGTRPEGVRGEEETARFIREMFSRIAPRYDLLNRVLSLSLDQVWRRRTARALAAGLASPHACALDLCCGTGDLTLALAQVSGGKVIGSDFSHSMLMRAQRKAGRKRERVRWLEADALQLPFAAARFDVVTAAFGFRNLANYRRGLEEILRVLKPGGEVGILEFVLPQRGLLAGLYGLYFRRVLPWLGRVVSGVPGPYSYLPASVEQFPDCAEFAAWFEAAGLVDVSYELWTGGTVALYRGQKPASSAAA
jgi:demethylmenaquinone methyltransferase/2-methoxy-6-polyprenyl-1,4-benzoquinol methylase